MIRQCFFLLLGLAFLASSLEAMHAAIITADSVTTSARSGSGSRDPNWDTVIQNIIDGSGLSTTVTDANYTTVTHELGFSSSIQWVDVGATLPVSHITFGFDTPVNLNQMLIWNYTQSNLTNRGINTFDVEVDTGSGFSTVVSDASINPAPYVAAQHTAQVVEIGWQTGVQQLRLANVTNQGGNAIGLDEVMFRQYHRWTGGAGTLNWADAENWNSNGVPPADSLIVFEGGVDAGATVSLAGLSSPYPYGHGTTEVWLNNGAGFTIGGFPDWTYWRTINVQDTAPYVIDNTSDRLAIESAGYSIDVVAGGSMELEGGLTVSGYGTGTLTKTGEGTLYLTGGRPGNNSTVNMISREGTLSTASVNNLGTGYLAVQQGGTFEYTGTGAETKTGSLHWNSGNATIDVTSPTANLTFDIIGGTRNQPFTKAGPGQLTLRNGGTTDTVNVSAGTLQYEAATTDTEVNGALSGSGTVNFSAAEGRIIRIEAPVSLTGQINVVGAGTVRNDSLVADWNDNLAGLDVADGATFDLRGNQVWVDSLTSGGAIINSYYRDNSGIRGHTLTVGVNNGSGTFSGTISGTGTTANQPGQIALVKTGTGTLTLTGDNTYAGPTTVEGGTLLINNTSGFGTGSGPVVVKPNGTLGGTGTIGGATTIEGGGTLAPGASIDTLNFLDTLTLKDEAVWDWEFAGTETPGEFNYDQVVGPRLDLDGIVTLNIYGDGSLLTAGESRFTLFTGDVYDGATLLPPGQDANHLFEIIDHTDWWGDWEVTGGSLMLTAVPEPGAWLLLLWALACGLLVRRR